MLRITRANTLEKNSLFGFASSGAWMDGGSRRLQHEYSQKKKNMLHLVFITIPWQN